MLSIPLQRVQLCQMSENGLTGRIGQAVQTLVSKVWGIPSRTVEHACHHFLGDGWIVCGPFDPVFLHVGTIISKHQWKGTFVS